MRETAKSDNSAWEMGTTYGRIDLIGAGPVHLRLNTVCDYMPYAIAVLFDVLKRRRLCVNVICRSCPTRFNWAYRL